MMPKMKRARFEPAEFVTVWQKATSVQEVSSRTGLPRRSASVRASMYRKKGIPLKKMGGHGMGKPLDVQGLSALAKRLAS